MVSRGSFEGNTYTGKGGDDNFIDYTLDINAGADIVITNNVITVNRAVVCHMTT
jgi:hypothetical protein